MLDGKKTEKTSKAKKQADDAEAVDDTPDAVGQNQKSDFVRGSVILFQDDTRRATLFVVASFCSRTTSLPSRWVSSLQNGMSVMVAWRQPLLMVRSMRTVMPPTHDSRRWPDVFTLEWDEFFCKAGDIPDFPFEFQFLDASGNQTGHIYLRYRPGNPDCYGNYTFKKGGGIDQNVGGSMDWDHLKQYTKVGQWNHFAISFNKRAFKFYLNGTRIINLPNVAAPLSRTRIPIVALPMWCLPRVQ